MSVTRTVAEILEKHTTLEVECIDRMYLNLYVPLLQTEGGIAHFFRHHRGHSFASSALMQPMTQKWVAEMQQFAENEGIEMITFARKQRKEDVAKEYLKKFEAEEGILFIGKAQEKCKVVRTNRRRNPKTGASYANLYMTTAMVNQYYIYCVDKDFGLFFLKFSSYFPYNGKLLINGHEYAKRQLKRRGIAYQALDNGVLSCEEPAVLQRICDSLSHHKIDRLLRKWLRRLPHPFTRQDRAAGHRYDISILQAEFSLTQVLDRPMTGRMLFEQLIRENLDLGRPDRVGLIFDRRVIRSTKGKFRTRIITNGVIPSLHFDYKHSRIKQYHKEGRALRTETTINDTYDFQIGRRLHNLPQLREVGFKANRRLLHVQRISHDCTIGQEAFEKIHKPAVVDGQRVAGLRFGDPRVLALLSSIILFRLLPRGFSNQDLRHNVAPLLGLSPSHFTQGKMTYDLRRLRLHGMIERITKTNRYTVTDFGFRTAMLITRTYNGLIRPALSIACDTQPPKPTKLEKAFVRIDELIDKMQQNYGIAV